MLTDDVRRTLEGGRGKSSRRVLAPVAAAVLLALVLGARLLIERPAIGHGAGFKADRVRRQDVSVAITATGTIKGLNTLEVGAEVTGKILHVFVDYNTAVQKGQLLAEIDPEQLRAAVQEARAQVLLAESNIKAAEATRLESERGRVRAEKQGASGLVAQKDVESSQTTEIRAEASLASSKASAQIARATLDSAISRLAKTKILSPFDGIVLARLVDPGQTVNAGLTTPILFKLAEDLRKLALDVDVDEADVGHLREGMEASFTNPPLLLADEPTGNLDTTRKDEIMELLARLNRDRGTTIVVVTHAHDIARWARRIIEFRNGTVWADESNTSRVS